MDGDMEKGHDGLYPTMTTSKALRTQRRASDTFLRQAKDAAFYYKIMFYALLFWGLALLWREVHAAVALRRVCSQANCARKVLNVPSYALEYAPLVWLDESESYFPSDIYAQVANTHPYVNLSIINDAPSPLTLENLDKLNAFGDNGNDVFLTSTIDVTTNPTWLDGVVPDSKGKTNGATSCAVIINDHGMGLVDVFYMYFYAYNQGNTVLSHELGDHIGDWEHNMIRFQDGKPQVMWFSQHGNGEAFTYAAVEKDGIRPISYSARGSHANYAVAGNIDHTVPDFNSPIGFLLDHTSQGVLWDPTLNTYFYTYNATDKTFSSIGDEESPLGAMNFKGKWGDEQYPESDKRQPKPFFGFYKYVGGPTGPYDKQLNRTQPCPNNGIRCIIREVRGVSYDEEDEEIEED